MHGRVHFHSASPKTDRRRREPLDDNQAKTTALSPLPISAVTIQDEFWAPKLKVWREVTIVDSLAKFEKDGSFGNYDRVRDGLEGEHRADPDRRAHLRDDLRLR